MRIDWMKYIDQWIATLVANYDIELAWAALIVFILSMGTVLMVASTCFALIYIPYLYLRRFWFWLVIKRRELRG